MPYRTDEAQSLGLSPFFSSVALWLFFGFALWFGSCMKFTEAVGLTEPTPDSAEVTKMKKRNAKRYKDMATRKKCSKARARGENYYSCLKANDYLDQE